MDDPFDVEVVEGDINLYNNTKDDNVKDIENLYFPDKLSPGSSIGSAQSGASGALGF